MIYIGLFGVAIILIYFFAVTKREDETWKSYRARFHKKRQRPVREQTINPVFQFDKAPEPAGDEPKLPEG